jgi:ribosomal subunit interface protein
MEPRISVRNGKVSDKTKEHIVKVCDKLNRFYDRIIDFEVVLGEQKQGKEVEFILKVPHQTLTASCVGENLYKALDEVEKRIEVQLKKYHDKQVEHRP